MPQYELMEMFDRMVEGMKQVASIICLIPEAISITVTVIGVDIMMFFHH